MLKPAESLITDNLFWRQQSDGLALFIDPDIYLYYRVPIYLIEEVGVAERFYIKPLVSLLSDCGLFYVLAISQDEIRLLQCTAFGSVRIKLLDLPRNMPEALGYETPDNRLQYHVATPSGGSNFGGATAIQTGEGSRPNYHKRNIMQYLDRIGKGINKIVKLEKAPMVLAGVDYLHPMYHEANIYHNLLPEGILGTRWSKRHNIAGTSLEYSSTLFRERKKESLSGLSKIRRNRSYRSEPGTVSTRISGTNQIPFHR
jgi:hypothetical protein